MNPILHTDSYKMSHYLQYPPGTTKVWSYIEARGLSNEAKRWFDQDKYGPVEIVHFGAVQFALDYLRNPITADDVARASDICRRHGVPFNLEDWIYIVTKHGGFLPLRIQSLPSGLPVPIGTPQIQVVNTDDRLPWLTSFVETALLRAIWYPSTVATVSREIKKRIQRYMALTCDTLHGLDYKLHDFGARGASSSESAGLGGLAHLINFQGTDTMEALEAFDKYYAAYSDIDMPGFSIPAAEHSTITSWGRNREVDAYRNMIEQFSKPGALFSVVSDSYDIYNAVSNIWGDRLRHEVMSRGGTLVIRPDSGRPNEVVLAVLESLAQRFGFTTNGKGYKVLPPYLRIIQGDGMEPDTIVDMMDVLMNNGWSIDNIAFGMGGGLLQKVNRDTFKYAMKASAAHINGELVDVFKEPVTDKGKKSKRGVQQHHQFEVLWEAPYVRYPESFSTIRKNAALSS